MIIGLTSRQWSGTLKATDITEQFKNLENEKNINLKDEAIGWKWRREITTILEPWFETRAVEDFARDFDNTGLTWSVFRSVKEALEFDPDLVGTIPSLKNKAARSW